MVDSSVGGKTGVDLPQGKNLVGAFWQPRLVWMDLSVLSTLPAREWRTGLAETIKYGFIGDRRILDLFKKESLKNLKTHPSLLESVVVKSAAMKASLVSRDERETRGLREKLNFGHTFGHALETVTGYSTYTHGEAISVGMCAAVRLGAELGTFPRGNVVVVDDLFNRWGLPTRARQKPSRTRLIKAMSRDKKAVGGRLRFVIPQGWGRVTVVENVPPKILDKVLREVGL
jgi:3-dehydroquinate synthetase